MCGVLGIKIKNAGEEDYALVRNLFLQSMIRGKHATGVSYVKNGEIVTIKEPIPANEFIAKHDVKDWVNEDGNLYCIGHIRYSTSDLNYNQPFSSADISIVHNGVISQEDPTTWEETYGLKTNTANDSELILRCIENGGDPLTKFNPASMAVCVLFADKTLVGFRNEARPLYYYTDSTTTVLTSTENIGIRAGLVGLSKTDMYKKYIQTEKQYNEFEISLTPLKNVEDLQ
jgi:glutamine phosphoribosylpyrophosphate amidotransferase